jgi:hypothetical protein
LQNGSNSLQESTHVDAILATESIADHENGHGATKTANSGSRGQQDVPNAILIDSLVYGIDSTKKAGRWIVELCEKVL